MYRLKNDENMTTDLQRLMDEATQVSTKSGEVMGEKQWERIVDGKLTSH